VHVRGSDASADVRWYLPRPSSRLLISVLEGLVASAMAAGSVATVNLSGSRCSPLDLLVDCQEAVVDEVSAFVVASIGHLAPFCAEERHAR
jgi:hypothetical protein